MTTLAQIEDFLLKQRFHDARTGCLKLLEKDRKNGQAWAFLGHAMVGLKKGEMAKLCFDRSSLLDPFAPWTYAAYQSAEQAGNGEEDRQVLHLLKVPHQPVSATVLTKNSERTIKACLENLLNAVDEIIVVDTGSTDSTINIVESIGIEVHPFQWVDDFAAARNFANSLVTNDWIIAVDSDEILYSEDVDSIRTVAGLFFEQPFLIKVLQMNQIANYIEPFQAGRMVKRTHGFTWAGRIHENLYPPEGELVNSIAVRIRLLHDGYDPQKVNLNAKIERNVTLLKLEIEDHPDQPGPYYFIARELMTATQYEGAVSYLNRANDLIDNKHPMLPDLRKGQFDAYNSLGQFLDAENIMAQLTRELPDYPDGWYWLGMQKLKRSDTNMNEVIYLIRKAKQLATVYRGQSNFDIALATWKSDYVLAVIAEQLGQPAEARKLYVSALQHNPQLQGARDGLNRLE